MLDKEGHFAGAAAKLLPPYVLNFMTCLKRVLNYPNKWCRHGTQQQMIFQVEDWPFTILQLLCFSPFVSSFN